MTPTYSSMELDSQRQTPNANTRRLNTVPSDGGRNVTIAIYVVFIFLVAKATLTQRFNFEQHTQSPPLRNKASNHPMPGTTLSSGIPFPTKV